MEKLTEAEKTAQVFEDPRWSAHSLTMDDTKQERGKRRMTRDSMEVTSAMDFPLPGCPGAVSSKVLGSLQVFI